MKHLVQIREYERGWGSRLEIEKLFDTDTEAIDFCKDYNKDNNLPVVPDYYWKADYIGTVSDNYDCKK